MTVIPNKVKIVIGDVHLGKTKWNINSFLQKIGKRFGNFGSESKPRCLYAEEKTVYFSYCILLLRRGESLYSENLGIAVQSERYIFFR
jgi:hypothetical protein